MADSVISCGALERSDNPYIELTMKSCVSKNRKEIIAMWVLLGKKY